MFLTISTCKDLRNKVENGNPSSVLDGNIDQFIEEELKIGNEKISKFIYFISSYFVDYYFIY